MAYFIFLLIGASIATLVLVILFYGNFTLLRTRQRRIISWDNRLKSHALNLDQRAKDFEFQRSQLEDEFRAIVEQYNNFKSHYEDEKRKVDEEITAKKKQFNQDVEDRRQIFERDIENRRQELENNFAAKRSELERDKDKFADVVSSFESRKVKYDDLSKENGFLKQDLFNLSVQLKKMYRDQTAITQKQEEIYEKTNRLAERYLGENVSWIGKGLTSNNFVLSKKRLLDAIASCRGIGFDIPVEREEEFIQDLKKEYEEAVRKEYAREEQARIRAQIREEEKVAREYEKKQQDLDREIDAIRKALEKALKEARDIHSAEVEYLQNRLKEAEENKRAISQAQMTKSGHVYVLSNIGSFGENVFKIGMTRRLDPKERVYELSGASVPFPFDVHMMIASNDAPTLENLLHREFDKLRLNKVNRRKEFFHIDLDSIRKLVESQPGEVKIVEFQVEPIAEAYRQSLDISDEDFEFIEKTQENVMGSENYLSDDD